MTIFLDIMVALKKAVGVLLVAFWASNQHWPLGNDKGKPCSFCRRLEGAVVSSQLFRHFPPRQRTPHPHLMLGRLRGQQQHWHKPVHCSRHRLMRPDQRQVLAALARAEAVLLQRRQQGEESGPLRRGCEYVEKLRLQLLHMSKAL